MNLWQKLSDANHAAGLLAEVLDQTGAPPQVRKLARELAAKVHDAMCDAMPEFPEDALAEIAQGVPHRITARERDYFRDALRRIKVQIDKALQEPVEEGTKP